MKTILILCPSIAGLGGVERVVINLANELSHKYNVIIGTLDNRCPSYKLWANVKWSVFAECRYRKYKIFSHIIRKMINCGYINANSNLVEQLFYPQYRKESFGRKISHYKTDVIVGVGVDMTIIASYYKQIFGGVKVVGWQHNEFQLYFETPGVYYYGLLEILNKRSKYIDKNIVITDNEEKVFNKKSKIVSQRIYNPLCICTDSCHHNCNSKKKKNILFVGRIVKGQKGIDFLVEILSGFWGLGNDAWEATIIGDGPDLNYLKREIVKRHLQKKVKIIGGVNDVSKYYKESSILVSTSRWEGFGLVIIEAFYFGLNVIAFDNEGPSELIKDGFNGFIIPKYDIDQFVNKLAQVSNDENLRYLISNNARKISERYLPENIYAEWLEILKEV